MDLHLHESVLLLGLDDETGKFTVDIGYFDYALAVGLIMDLILAERIEISGDGIRVKTNALTDNKVLNEALYQIVKKDKNRKISDWIHTFVRNSGKLRSNTVDNLTHSDILEKRKEKFLWVFNVNRYPSINSQPENQLRSRLINIIFEEEKPTPKERMLLTIIKECKQEALIMPDKSKRKEARDRLEELTTHSEMQKHISKAIVEMQTAVMIAVTTVV